MMNFLPSVTLINGHKAYYNAKLSCNESDIGWVLQLKFSVWQIISAHTVLFEKDIGWNTALIDTKKPSLDGYFVSNTF